MPIVDKKKRKMEKTFLQLMNEFVSHGKLFFNWYRSMQCSKATMSQSATDKGGFRNKNINHEREEQILFRRIADSV